jgi:iron complex transport system ATP-binding protein
VTPVYDVRALEVTLGERKVLGPLDLQVPRGSFLGILGPNGSGKTTLLRALTGGLRPSAGEILFEQRPLHDYRASELARLAGVVPQQFSLDFNFTVEEMVAMGRYAHADRAADGTAVTSALQATGMTELSGRLVTELSGGERQRALIAQTLAQETPTLLLDEPLNNLDLNHQLEIMQLLRCLHAAGRTIVIVVHDLNMASQYCDELLLLDHGRVAALGTPEGILDPRMILEVFKVRVAVHRQGRRPYLTPIWSEAVEMPVAGGQAMVHVVAGGGAASELLEELERYELRVVSAPPFEPFPPEAVAEYDALAREAEVTIVAPVFFSRGNLAPLKTALRAAQAGKKVIVIARPPIAERDISGGEATALVGELLAAGALEVAGSAQAIDRIAT